MNLEELINQSNALIRQDKDNLVAEIKIHGYDGKIDDIITIIKQNKTKLDDDASILEQKIIEYQKILEKRSKPVLKLTQAALTLCLSQGAEMDDLDDLLGEDNKETNTEVDLDELLGEQSATEEVDLDALLDDVTQTDSPDSVEAPSTSDEGDGLDALLEETNENIDETDGLDSLLDESSDTEDNGSKDDLDALLDTNTDLTESTDDPVDEDNINEDVVSGACAKDELSADEVVETENAIEEPLDDAKVEDETTEKDISEELEITNNVTEEASADTVDEDNINEDVVSGACAKDELSADEVVKTEDAIEVPLDDAKVEDETTEKDISEELEITNNVTEEASIDTVEVDDVSENDDNAETATVDENEKSIIPEDELLSEVMDFTEESDESDLDLDLDIDEHIENIQSGFIASVKEAGTKVRIEGEEISNEKVLSSTFRLLSVIDGEDTVLLESDKKETIANEYISQLNQFKASELCVVEVLYKELQVKRYESIEMPINVGVKF